PGMDGTGLAAALRPYTDSTELQIVMLASWNRPLDMADLPGLGIKACLTKPIRRSRLLNVLLQHSLGPDTPAGHGGMSSESLEPERPPILVAEDHEVNQLVVSELLRSLGYRCQIVSNGLQALTACR